MLIIRGRFVRVARIKGESFDNLVDVPRLVRSVRDGGDVVDVLTLVQTLPHMEPKFDYPKEWDNVAAVQVSTFDNWWTKQVDRKTRNIVRKSANQGITVREVPFDDVLVRGIWEIYNEVPVRHGKRFWHYGKEIETVKRENATFVGRSVFLAAFCDEHIVGFAKLVITSDALQARLMQILSLVSHRDKSPTNALLAEAVRVCADRKIGYLCYGKYSYGRKERDSLTDFKANNGFQRFEVPRYYIPLTWRGRVGVRLGLHHRVADRIPKPLIDAFRNARWRWYTGWRKRG